MDISAEQNTIPPKVLDCITVEILDTRIFKGSVGWSLTLPVTALTFKRLLIFKNVMLLLGTLIRKLYLLSGGVWVETEV